MGVGTVDGQTRTIGGAGHLAADTALAALETRLLSLKLVHAYSLDVPSPNGVMAVAWPRLLGSLAKLTTDVLTLVVDALALVRLGRALVMRILGGNLANLLLGDALDRDVKVLNSAQRVFVLTLAIGCVHCSWFVHLLRTTNLFSNRQQRLQI